MKQTVHSVVLLNLAYKSVQVCPQVSRIVTRRSVVCVCFVLGLRVEWQSQRMGRSPVVAGRRGERRDLNILDRRDQAATFVANSQLNSPLSRGGKKGCCVFGGRREGGRGAAASERDRRHAAE